MFLKAAESIQQATTTGATFAAIAEELPVTVAEIGIANAEAKLDSAVRSGMDPFIYHFPQQVRWSGSRLRQHHRSNPCGPKYAGVDLSAGVVLITPQRNFQAPGLKTLLDLAQQNFTTVESIALSNAAKDTILSQGMPVVVDAVALEVQEGDSFDKLVLRFAERGVITNPQSIAVANQETPGLIVAESSLDVNAYVIQSGDTFAAIILKFPAWTAAG